ncbi:hypothetical protein [Polaribacter sp. Asnod6-C07]|uniref:hypothetical protein n=1 Tax=Polaribacter sp. Asnod6-C07 TaxID=3160582 RepID=UPI003870DCD6
MNITQIRNNQTIKMRNQDTTATFSSQNSSTNYASKTQSLIYQFRDWIREFLDNAE